MIRSPWKGTRVAGTGSPRWQWLPADTATAALLGLILLWPNPHLPGLRPPNELSRVYATRALVDDHTLSIDGPMKRQGGITDFAEREGRRYSDKAPGLSLLAAPIYGLLRLIWSPGQLSNRTLILLFRWILIVGPSLGFIALLAPWLRSIGIRSPIARATQVAYGLGTPAFAYAMKFVGHQAAAWMIGLALMAAWAARGGRRSFPAAAGLLSGMAAITEYPAAPMVGVLAALVGLRSRRPGADLMAFGLGALGPLTVLAAYHTVAFGAPWLTGYHFIKNPSFSGHHVGGIAGVGWPRRDALIGVLFSSHRGLLVVAPWLVFSLGGLFALRRRDLRPLVIVLALHGLLHLWVATGFGYWLGGWSVGPRHLVAALPSFAVLAGLGWDRFRGTSLAAVAAGWALASCLIGLGVATTYPGFPEDVLHPLRDLTWPMLARGQFSHSVGSGLGLPPAWGMGLVFFLAVPLAAVVMARALESRGKRTRWGSGIVGWVAVLTLAAVLWSGPPPTDQARFRVAWLTQRMWSPAHPSPAFDPRLAHWEKSWRRLARGRGRPEDVERMGAMAAHQGRHLEALGHYARARWWRRSQTAPPPTQ